MQENLFWTERITLNRVLDPLGLASLRDSDQYFLNGITTQTHRLRHYTFLVWAFNEIVDRKSPLPENKILDLEKILALASAQHHENGGEPTGIRSIPGAKNFLLKNSQIDVDKFTHEEGFGKNNKIGYGRFYYQGPLASLNIVRRDQQLIISPAGKEISTEFSKSIETIEGKIWSKTLTKSDLQNMKALCCCSLSFNAQEQDLWKKVFFGLTTGNRDSLEIDHSKTQIVLTDPDELPFEKYQNLQEDEIIENLDSTTEYGGVDDKTSVYMRQGTLFLLLEIIKNSKPKYEKNTFLQTIRDYIYYSPINFNKLEPYRKYWEVYVHNIYYTIIFEKVLSIIIDICKDNPLGISKDKLVSKINSKKFLDSIRNFGFKISDSDNVQTVYEKLENVLGSKKTTLHSPINERKLLEKIRITNDKSEVLGLIFVLFLLCKYRYSVFDKKKLRVLPIKRDKFQDIFPETIYGKFSKTLLTEFPEHLLKFMIKRHRYISAKKYRQGTKAWLFTIDNDVLYFNQKEWELNRYRDYKWTYVLEIMNDLGLIKKNSNKKIWEITVEGEEWLKKIQ